MRTSQKDPCLPIFLFVKGWLVTNGYFIVLWVAVSVASYSLQSDNMCVVINITVARKHFLKQTGCSQY